MVESIDKTPIVISTEEQLNKKKITKLMQKWSMWECYVSKSKGEANFDKNIQKVCEFQEIQDFINIFAYLPHGKPSQLFYDIQTQEIKKFKTQENQDEFKQIDTLCLFKEDIIPKWEDSKNAQGGSHHYTLPADVNIEQLDKLWLTTCCYLVGGCYPFNEIINGIRLVEKTGFKPETRQYKLEFWLETDKEKNTENKNFHNKITQEIMKTLSFCEIYQYKDYQYRPHKK